MVGPYFTLREDEPFGEWTDERELLATADAAIERLETAASRPPKFLCEAVTMLLEEGDLLHGAAIAATLVVQHERGCQGCPDYVAEAYNRAAQALTPQTLAALPQPIRADFERVMPTIRDCPYRRQGS